MELGANEIESDFKTKQVHVNRMNNINNHQQGHHYNNSLVTKNNICKKFLHGEPCSNNCRYSHDESKIKVCNKWKQTGQCNKGNNCDFQHPNQNNVPCVYFQKDQCTKQNCSYKHVYKPCINFDMGYCPLGKDCEFKHVQRKLCLNYMYGFCPLGPDCTLFHPPTITQNDIEFTLNLYRYLDKQSNGVNVENMPKIYQCYTCRQYGHKSTNCYSNNKMELQPTQEIVCGLCDKKHQIQFLCEEQLKLKESKEEFQE